MVTVFTITATPDEVARYAEGRSDRLFLPHTHDDGRPLFRIGGPGVVRGMRVRDIATDYVGYDTDDGQTSLATDSVPPTWRVVEVNP
jgi:hypothetical protein